MLIYRDLIEKFPGGKKLFHLFDGNSQSEELEADGSTEKSEPQAVFERRIMQNGLWIDGELGIDLQVLKEIKGVFRYVVDDTKMPFETGVKPEWAKLVEIFREFDLHLAQSFERQWKKNNHKAARDDFLFVVANAGMHLDSVFPCLEAENTRLSPAHSQSTETQAEVSKALMKDPRNFDRGEVKPRIENPITYKLARILEWRNTINDPVLLKTIDLRIKRLLKKAEGKDADQGVSLINEKSFQEETLLLIALARSESGESPSDFESMARDTEVKIFEGGALIGEPLDPENPEFLYPHTFGPAEWKMLMDNFEKSYGKEYPKFAQMLKMALLEDLNNDAAKFYFIYHEGKLIGTRKTIKKGDLHYGAGTFYVDERYAGIGEMIENWTLQDLPKGAVVDTIVAPKNPHLPRHLSRGRWIETSTQLEYNGQKSEPVFQLKNEIGYTHPSHDLEDNHIWQQAQEGDIEEVPNNENHFFTLPLSALNDEMPEIMNYLAQDRVISRMVIRGEKLAFCGLAKF